MKGDGALTRMDNLADPNRPRMAELLRMMEPGARHRHVLALAQSRYGNGWQSELARGLEVNPRTVRRWVQDLNANTVKSGRAPSLDYLPALAIHALCTGH